MFLLTTVLFAASWLAAIAQSAADSVERNATNVSYILPETFGKYSLGSCSGAPSCGTAMASYNGISAYSNGAEQCTGSSCAGYGTYGYQYQCVELAQRYFAKKFGTTPIWYGNAIDLCHTYPSGVSKTSSPIPGDLVVFDTGTYGHVAVITKFSGSSMDVLEQNSSPTGKNTYSTGSVACYLHADKNSGGGSCNAAGWYCGDDNLQKDANTNYFCDGPGGSVTEHEDCGFTCVTNLSGYNDYCTSGGSCSGLYGYYCGNDKVNAAESDVLYFCNASHKPEGAKKCANGCHVADSGYDDYCK